MGYVIKQQAGTKYYKIVEEIRIYSKNYRATKNEKYLNEIFKSQGGEIIEKNNSKDMAEINSLIAQLWYTRDTRSSKPNPLDEVKSLIFYLDILYRNVYNDLISDQDISNGNSNFNISFGSWVGADKDGNPYVTTKVTKEALKIYSNQIISIYKEKIIELSDDFSVSTNFVDCPEH